MPDKPTTVEEYIDGFPDEVQLILRRTREALLEAIPGGTEKIRYGMPAVVFGSRYAIHYGAWKKHLGLYPVPMADAELEPLLEPLRTTRSTVAFVYSRPVPYELIRRIARYLVETRAGADGAE